MSEQRTYRRGRESALFGVTRRYGQSLSFADRVIANFRTEEKNEGRVAGALFTHDAKIPAVFEKDRVGELEALPQVGEIVKVRVDCRPWISGTGQLSFIVQKFQVLEGPATDEPDSEASADPVVDTSNVADSV